MEKVLCFMAVMSLLFFTSCRKEYSFEGSTLPSVDTLGSPTPASVTYNFPICSVCLTSTTTELSDWSFKMESIPACGKADTAILLGNRTAFTFFGPSSCSIDTGMVITVYLRDTLNKNLSYISADKAAFYYYDHVTPSYIMMSQAYAPFSVTIQDYNHQTKIATGTFEGVALRSDGHWISINSGQFKMKLL